MTIHTLLIQLDITNSGSKCSTEALFNSHGHCCSGRGATNTGALKPQMHDPTLFNPNDLHITPIRNEEGPHLLQNPLHSFHRKIQSTMPRRRRDLGYLRLVLHNH